MGSLVVTPTGVPAARRLAVMAAGEESQDPREEVRSEIREFLSTRRARLTPGDAGLPNYGGERRRVAGLRRDEIAVLAGVSPQYYVRLERGDATGVSTSVIDSIARAPCSSTKPNTHCAELARGRTTRPR